MMEIYIQIGCLQGCVQHPVLILVVKKKCLGLTGNGEDCMGNRISIYSFGAGINFDYLQFQSICRAFDVCPKPRTDKLEKALNVATDLLQLQESPGAGSVRVTVIG